MSIEGSNSSQHCERIRLGMVGGGQGAFIGAVHRIAARMDDHYELMAGALSSEPERAIASALELGIAQDRAYPDYKQMVARERRLKKGVEVALEGKLVHRNYEGKDGQTRYVTEIVLGEFIKISKNLFHIPNSFLLDVMASTSFPAEETGFVSTMK